MLSEALVRAATGQTKRLMVFMPPRHGKSELISRYTPPWFLGRWPDKQVMLCSYADTFAASWGRRARDVMREFGPSVFGQTVNPETAGGAQWEVLNRRGIMVTAGVGGGITGKGADLMIIDDPVKNAMDAASQVIQQAQVDWWYTTARTRLMPGASVVLLMTRWHEADLAGRLIADWQDGTGDEWEIISLPALSEGRSSVSYPPSKSLDMGTDALGRAEGKALWPCKPDGTVVYDEAYHEQTKRANLYVFNALYQQRPSAAEGNLFMKKNFRYYTKEAATENGDRLVRIHRESGNEVFDTAYKKAKFCTVDTAASEKTTADHTVVSTWVVTVNHDLLLWEREREQFTGPDVKTLLKRVFFAQRPGMIYVESAVCALSIIEELIREGLPIIPLSPDKDKVSRSLPMVARYGEHRVFHPLAESWVQDEWEPELLNFPNAMHDDQVDTAAYAGMQLSILAPMLNGGAGSRAPVSGTSTLTSGLRDQEF
jgi:predicted phage terminase large subunit-like protein